MNGPRVATLKLLLPMWHAIVLVLSWVGAWVGEKSVEECECHCNCSCTFERVDCPPIEFSWGWEIFKLSIALICGICVGAGKIAFIFIQCTKWLLTFLSDRRVEVLGDGCSDTLHSSHLSLANPPTPAPDHQALAKQQLALLKSRRGVQ